MEDNWGILVKGAHTPLELCDDRGLSESFGGSVRALGAQWELWGLSQLPGDGAVGATALQQCKESCEVLSKARSSTHSCLELQLLGWLFLNFLRQLLMVSMGRGGS